MIEIRDMKPEDIPEVVGIETENFSRPWKEQGFLEAVNSPNTIYLVAVAEAHIVGYAGMWAALDEGEITNVSVKKSCWGMGVGKKLMEAMERFGSQAGVTSFFLEVRQSNERAVALYQSCGFEEVGIRKDFYEAPRENAIVMCKR